MVGVLGMLGVLGASSGARLHAQPPSGAPGCEVVPAVELLSVVQLLAGGIHNDFDYAYRREVMQRFAPFANHPAVVRARTLVSPGFNDFPASLGSRLSAAPALRVERPLVPVRDGPTMIGAAAIRDYLALVRDFARQSDFPRFYAEHQPLYQRWCDAVRADIDPRVPDVVARWYGVRAHSYGVALMPLVPFLGVAAPNAPTAAGDLVAFVGLRGAAGDAPLFPGESRLTRVLLHEFSHPYVNAAVATAVPALARSAPLFDPVRRRLWRADRIATWPGAVTETVVRAAVLAMSEELAADTSLAGELAWQRQIGFVYIGAVAEGLREYGRNRARYRRFATFFPRVVRVFDELAARPLPDDVRDPPFAGGIAGAILSNPEDFVVFIVPTEERDRAVQDSLYVHIRAVCAARYPNARIITDHDALGRDLSANTLWAVGTVEGNAWLRAHRDRIPALMDSTRVTLDSVVEGRGLVFVSALPSPANPRRMLLVTIGQRVYDVTRGWWVVASDYAVVDGGRVLRRGDYVKGGARWGFAGGAQAGRAP